MFIINRPCDGCASYDFYCGWNCPLLARFQKTVKKFRESGKLDGFSI